MTFNNTKPMSFGKFFSMLWKYWDYTSKRGTDYSTLEVLLLTNLRTRWGKNGWDVEELKWIYVALDHNDDILNPNYFTNCRFAYLDYIKACYYLEHNG